jgi:hypothetical protein
MCQRGTQVLPRRRSMLLRRAKRDLDEPPGVVAEHHPCLTISAAGCSDLENWGDFAG